jgi:hypothetical protein
LKTSERRSEQTKLETIHPNKQLGSDLIVAVASIGIGFRIEVGRLPGVAPSSVDVTVINKQTHLKMLEVASIRELILTL